MEGRIIYIKNYICGHVVEVVSLEKMGGAIGRFKKIDKDKMLDEKTGEVVEVNHSKSRNEQLYSLYGSIRKLRMIINANFFGGKNELFVTLTYAENMTDLNRLYDDFRRFMMRIRYRYKESDLEYIAVPEPQQRGAWHLHLLLKAENKEYLYIPNEEVAGLWRMGFTKTERLEKVDNVGAYLSAYLTDLVDEKTGKKCKGARLYLYPSGMNLYRCSRGIKKPQIVAGDLGLDEKNKVYENEFEITRDEEVVNRVVIKQYNMKRNKGKSMCNKSNFFY